MDLSQIKQLVQRNGDRVILVENDRPEIVVMSFQEYEKIASGAPAERGGRSQRSDSVPAPQAGKSFTDDFSGLFDQSEGSESMSMFNSPAAAPAKERSASFGLSSGSNPSAARPAPARIEDLALDDLPFGSPLP